MPPRGSPPDMMAFCSAVHSTGMATPAPSGNIGGAMVVPQTVPSP